MLGGNIRQHSLARAGQKFRATAQSGMPGDGLIQFDIPFADRTIQQPQRSSPASSSYDS